MKYQRKSTISFLSLAMLSVLFLLPSCGSTPTSQKVDGPPSAESVHAEGAKLYRRNCLDCHGLYAPSRYNDSEWESIMQGMAVEANLSEEKHRLILAFLMASN